MSDQHDIRSARDVDVDAERFLVDDVDESADITSVVDLPPDGSIPDIIDQHTAVPDDDDEA